MSLVRATVTLLATLCCAGIPPAMAEAYKCADAAGNISYQQMPCSEGQQQALPVELQPALIEGREAVGTRTLPPQAGNTAGRLVEIARQEGGSGLRLAEAWARKPMPFAGGLPQGYAALAAVLVLAIVLFPGLFFWKKPKEKNFTCTHCERLAPHNPRTIDAWRLKKTEFFCDDCHARWLLAHPEHLFSKKRASHSGCLGVAILFAALPVLLFFG
ncbi:MAG: cold shock protein [Moraxellaceae bacterium]|jgi:uncharacterized protein YlaI|nr:cold shock protein [Moraxellaceae bacterium]